MNTRSRKGFTVVELLVVVVLGSLLLMATYQILATNTRVYALNNARVQGQQTLRAGADVLFGELREISSPEGDLITMGTNAVTIRAQRAFGVVCNVDYATGSPDITVLRVGPIFEVGDSVFVFHDNDPERSSDDEWFGGVVTAVDTSSTCGGSPAHTLSVPFLRTTASASPPDSVRVGAPIRGFERFSYGQYDFGGEAYLGRWGGTLGGIDPLVGPLMKTGGVSFRYLDDQGQATTVDTLVTQIEVTLRYEAPIGDFQGDLLADSSVVRIHLRN
jgi:prepilin-type N-terminal cleavage/methylation domain-containing protein